jgi:hypothetical protein
MWAQETAEEWEEDDFTRDPIPLPEVGESEEWEEEEQEYNPWEHVRDEYFEDVDRIASVITEDPDIFTKYSDTFNQNTVLDEETYGEIVGILKDVAKQNGLILNHRKLKIRFNPAGLTIKNIDLDCPDAHTKRELAKRVAAITGDDNIKHTFNKNLKVNLYNAINREFSDRVREELNLEVTHQTVEANDPLSAPGVLPMATFTQPAVRAEKPEEELEDIAPMGPEPEGGPEVPEPEMGDEGMGGLGGGGMGGLGGLPELPSEEGAEDIEAGPFGVEEPEEGAEEGEEGELEGGEEEEPAPPPEEGEELLSFESIERIASMLTEDPDIFSEGGSGEGRGRVKCFNPDCDKPAIGRSGGEGLCTKCYSRLPRKIQGQIAQERGRKRRGFLKAAVKALRRGPPA